MLEAIKNLVDDLTATEKSRLAIEQTRNSSETMGVKTRFSDYGLAEEVIEEIIASLKAHGMVKLGEKGIVTPRSPSIETHFIMCVNKKAYR